MIVLQHQDRVYLLSVIIFLYKINVSQCVSIRVGFDHFLTTMTNSLLYNLLKKIVPKIEYSIFNILTETFYYVRIEIVCFRLNMHIRNKFE